MHVCTLWPQLIRSITGSHSSSGHEFEPRFLKRQDFVFEEPMKCEFYHYWCEKSFVYLSKCVYCCTLCCLPDQRQPPWRNITVTNHSSKQTEVVMTAEPARPQNGYRRTRTSSKFRFHLPPEVIIFQIFQCTSDGWQSCLCSTQLKGSNTWGTYMNTRTSQIHPTVILQSATADHGQARSTGGRKRMKQNKKLLYRYTRWV